MLPDPTHPASIEILQADDRRYSAGLSRHRLDLAVAARAHDVVQTATADRDFRKFAMISERTCLTTADKRTPSSPASGRWPTSGPRTPISTSALRKCSSQSAAGAAASNCRPFCGLGQAAAQGHRLHLPQSRTRAGAPACFMARIAKNREVWAIPWLEGDRQLWHLQPRVAPARPCQARPRPETRRRGRHPLAHRGDEAESGHLRPLRRRTEAERR